MKEDKVAAKNSTTKENEPVLENGKKKAKEERPATKVVVRCLPPTMTEDEFKMQIAPIPDYDYFYYVPAEKSLAPNAFSRAYLNFLDQTDLFIFTQKFDGYVFLDSKGGEFPAVVEFAPFQRIPKNRPNRKKDPKVGTIDADPLFVAFKERLEAESLENRTALNASKQHFFETSLVPEEKEENNTPLLDYIKNRRAERQKIRDEKREEKKKKDLERKKTKEEQKRTKKDDDTSVVKKSSAPAQPKPKLPDQPYKSKEAIPCLINKKVEDNNCSTSEEHGKHPHTPPSAKSVEEHEISKKVRDLVNFFNKSITHSSSKELEKNSEITISLSNCVKHKDIESEIIRNISDQSSMQFKTVEISPKMPPTNWHAFSFPVATPHLKASNSIKACCRPIPLVRSRDRVFVPRSARPCVRSLNDIVLRPLRIASTTQQTCKKEDKSTVEDVKKSPKTNFPAEVFRKNLQKVVADVLGNSKVKSPKENVISKPKTFIKRVLVGSGEQCARPGFNSPSFYLPPRAFGCGQSESTNSEGKVSFPFDEKLISQAKPSKTIFSGKGHFPVMYRKSLPPFSKKSITSSKSDGDIEKPGNNVKVGGSQETLKTKIEPWTLGIKPQLIRRPHVTPRKSVILEKNLKVSL